MSLRIELAFGGQALATCTGFIALSAAGPVLLTNRHGDPGEVAFDVRTGICIADLLWHE